MAREVSQISGQKAGSTWVVELVLENFALVTDRLWALFPRFKKHPFSQAKQAPGAAVKVIVPDCFKIFFADIPEAVLALIDPATGKNRTIPVYGDSFPEEIAGGVLEIRFVAQVIVFFVICFVWTKPFFGQSKVFGSRW